MAKKGLVMGQPLLKVRHLKTQFKTKNGQVTAVDDVSFVIEEGETLGIVGESGCGKSVTSLSILHLLPQAVGKIAGGTIIYKGQDITSLDNKAMCKIRGKEISMIFQDSMTSLNPVQTVGKQLEETIKVHNKLPKEEIRKKALDILTKVGVSSPERRLREYPHQLSGGMRQRVMIAMALSCNPSLLIADEPTTALDVTIQAQIIDLMLELKKNINAAIMLITHDLGVVAELMEKVGLPLEFMNRYPHEFSGGQRQRIVIARALVLNPKFVVCDEPVSALDVSVRAQVLNLMKDLQRELSLTYLFISHDLSVVRYICDCIMVMYLGKVMEIADKKELYENPCHPYTKALMSAIPIPDMDVEYHKIHLEGDVPSPFHPPSGCRFHTRCRYATEKCKACVPELKDVGCAHMLYAALSMSERYGFSVENHEYYCGSAILKGTGEKEIGIFSHVDVVDEGSGWTSDPYDPIIKDSWIYARGSSDNKGPAVASLYALRYLKEQGKSLTHTIRLYYGCSEEHGMEDIEYYKKHYPNPAFSIVPDASFPVCYAEKGILEGTFERKLEGNVRSCGSFFKICVI